MMNTMADTARVDSDDVDDVEAICLRCNRPFMSFDPRRNRLCPECTTANANVRVTRMISTEHFDSAALLALSD
jgi:Zn finger protein HypA/HybF involved in hydrogenase expression